MRLRYAVAIFNRLTISIVLIGTIGTLGTTGVVAGMATGPLGVSAACGCAKAPPVECYTLEPAKEIEFKKIAKEILYFTLVNCGTEELSLITSELLGVESGGFKITDINNCLNKKLTYTQSCAISVELVEPAKKFAKYSFQVQYKGGTKVGGTREVRNP